MGLVETQQTLRMNGLRHRVRLQVDGGLKTGLDVVKAAILGADSFGFGTAPMLAIGCKYLRVCHLNNCATGVATQNETLRKLHFKGTKDKVVCYFQFVAEEVREILSAIGAHSLNDIIGRPELLEIVEGKTEKQQRLDLSPLLSTAEVPEEVPRRCTTSRNEPWDKGELAQQMVSDALPNILDGTGGVFEYPISNTNRSSAQDCPGKLQSRSWKSRRQSRLTSKVLLARVSVHGTRQVSNSILKAMQMTMLAKEWRAEKSLSNHLGTVRWNPAIRQLQAIPAFTEQQVVSFLLQVPQENDLR